MNDLPGWVEVIVAFAALVTALGVLWRQFVQPGVEFFARLLEIVGMLPWLRRLRAETDKEKRP